MHMFICPITTKKQHGKNQQRPKHYRNIPKTIIKFLVA